MYEPRPAVVVGAMRPILRGTVLSQKHADGSHDAADARLRQKYSIHPENRT
jgi:hypothetical protein